MDWILIKKMQKKYPNSDFLWRFVTITAEKYIFDKTLNYFNLMDIMDIIIILYFIHLIYIYIYENYILKLIKYQ
jgi:hypothetical protein